MLARYFQTALLAASLFAFIVGGCKDMGSEPTFADQQIDTTGGPIVRKPNLYLYPTRKQTISIDLAFPQGGRILESVPAYGEGWRVEVEPSGLINNLYRYLFYEAQAPDHYQYSEGWVVGGDTLTAFFHHVLGQVGFTEPEIQDFVRYWSPLLSSKAQYEIYPQDRQKLDELIQVDVSPLPDSQLRLALVIRTAKTTPSLLKEPQLTPVSRTGFFLAEWGVILK